MDKVFFNCVSFVLTKIGEDDTHITFRSSTTQPMNYVALRMEKHNFDSKRWNAVHNKHSYPNPISTLWKYEK